MLRGTTERRKGHLHPCSVHYSLTCIIAFIWGFIANTAFVQAGLTGPETALDKRTKAYLQQADKRWPLLGQDARYPKPNNELKYGFGETQYYQKALAVFGLIDMGAAPKSRIAEVNRILRYAVLGKWPATTPGSVIGQYAKVWNHRDRNLAMRLYMLYANWLEPDVKAEWNKRLKWFLTKPYTSSSENIRWSNNAAYFLSYEELKQTGTSGFKNVKAWVVSQLKRQGIDGPNEWGSFYNAWTYGSILNLAEFAKDKQVQTLAQMAFDIWLARSAGASIAGRLGTGGIRCYPWWIHGVLRGQTTCAQLMMMGTPEAKGGDWLEFAITNYRAPVAVYRMHTRKGNREAWIKSGNQADMRYYHYHGDGFLLGVTMSPEKPDIFRKFGGGTHDIAGVYVQSAKRKPGNPGQSSIMLLGYRPEKPPAKRINLVERYFGYKHVAFAQHGGTTKAVYASGTFKKVRIRLFATHDFSREFDSGWAFLTNGTTYVAWAPTIGNPENDPDSTSWFNPTKQGFVLRSSYAGDDNGEASVLDIGDAASYGSYANFKTQVKKRNPRPRWTNHKVTYKALDGTVLEWSNTGAKIKGVTWVRTAAPTTQMPGFQGLKITDSGVDITYDFNAGKVTGAVQRIASNMTFGVSGNTPPPGPLTIITPATLPGGTLSKPYGPVTLQAAGGKPPYTAWAVLGATSLPTGIALDSKSGVLAGTPQQAGSFKVTIQVTDSAKAKQNKQFTLSFSTSGPAKGKPPAAAKTPYVSSNSAQGGSAGNPVTNIDLSPVFSAIYSDPDSGDIADRFYLQVSTDDTFETIDGWNSGVTPLPSPVTNGARCVDIAYKGQPLKPNTLYYWRMIFIDAAGNWGALHNEQLSFKTAAANNNAPLAPSSPFVGANEAQTGTASSSTTPATGIDLTPVFSAVFEDPDATDTTTEVWIQVATDPSFQDTSLRWNAVPFGNGTGALKIPSCKAKSRCKDFAYAGKALKENTQYYWRMLFVDAAGQVGLASETASFITTADNAQPLAITTTTLANATEGQGYNQMLQARGGHAPYRWSTKDPMPAGISLDAVGSLFGTPREGSAGAYRLAITVADAKGTMAQTQLSLQIVAKGSPPGVDAGAPDQSIKPDDTAPSPDVQSRETGGPTGPISRETDSRKRGCECNHSGPFPSTYLFGALLCLLALRKRNRTI